MREIRLWTAASQENISKHIHSVIPRSWIRGIKLPEEGVLPDFEGAVVLALGMEPVEILKGLGLVPKNRTIPSLRGTPIDVNGADVFISYNPGITANDPTLVPEIQWDYQLAYRFASTGSMEPTAGAYEYADTLDEALQYLNSVESAVPVAVDLETLGLDPYAEGAWIVSFQISWEVNQALVIRFQGEDDPRYPTVNPKLMDQVEQVLHHPNAKIRGANFKFDMLWLREHWGIDASPRFSMDTTLVGSLLDENRSNSLNSHAKSYTPIGGYDDDFNTKYNKGRMDLVPDGPFLTYAGGDVDACLRVSNVFVNKLDEQSKLGRFYVKLLHPAMLAFHDMERTGICCDREYMEDLGRQLDEHAEALEERAYKMLPRRLQVRHGRDFRLTRKSITQQFLFSRLGLNLTPMMKTPKTGEPTVGMDHLSMFKDHPEAGPWVELIDDYSQTTKTRATYVTGFLSHLRSDGLWHPSAMLFKGAYEASLKRGADNSGTVTGRTAFRDPAVQTIPKHTKWAKILRRGFVAPPGYVFVSLDYSQGELRITACVANESRMIEAYRKGIDLHMLTGGELAGFDEQQMLEMKDKDPKMYAALRQTGKSANFGLIYGIGPEGYAYYAWSSYGVKLTIEEAAGYKERFFEGYPGLVGWHTLYKNLAHRFGYVESPLGRVRHLPLINGRDWGKVAESERQAINSPIQSTLSDLALLSLGKFRETYGCPDECKPCLMIHDQIGFYVKEDRVDVWVPRIKEIMENLPLSDFGWAPQLPFPVDVEVGYDLAHMEPLKTV